MRYMVGLACKECGEEYPADAAYMCRNCLGPLQVRYDYEAIRRDVSPDVIERRPSNLWRYRELLPVLGDVVTGEHSGFTPLMRARRMERRLGAKSLFIKDDSVNRPSLSYKDRVVSVALSRGVELGFKVFACASTGNLGNAVAAHCARSGFPALIFVPADIETPKITGALIHKPRVVAMTGNYDQVNRLCAEIGERYGWGFVNVNLRPYYVEGAKTFGYEIVEQLGWRLPDHLVLPTAGGTLLPKAAQGMREMRRLGWASGHCRIHAAQAAGCAPVIHALHGSRSRIDPVKPKTLAHSIAIGDPADGPYVLRELQHSGGWGEMVSDEEIVQAIELLAETEGIFTEPAGGTTLAVTIKLIREGRIDPAETIVVGITGNGYKTSGLFSDRLRVDARLRPNLGVFREWYETHAAELQAAQGS